MGQTAHEQLLGEYEVRAESYDEHASHGFIFICPRPVELNLLFVTYAFLLVKWCPLKSQPLVLAMGISVK
jgi:hypothetical protein